MYKKIIVATVLSISVVGCDSLFETEKSDVSGMQFISVPTQDFKKVTGHWVYNPGRCTGNIKIHGLLEYKFSDSGLAVGGSQVPLSGKLTSIEISDEIKEVFSQVKNCDQQDVKLSVDSKLLQFDSASYQLKFIINGSELWAIERNSKPFLLERFHSINFKNSEIIEPTGQELTAI